MQCGWGEKLSQMDAAAVYPVGAAAYRCSVRIKLNPANLKLRLSLAIMSYLRNLMKRML